MKFSQELEKIKEPISEAITFPELFIEKIGGKFGLFFRDQVRGFTKYPNFKEWITFRSLTAPFVGALAWAKRNKVRLFDKQHHPVNQLTIQHPKELDL